MTALHVWFGGILSFFPFAIAIALALTAWVGWLNRGDIHAREHVLDMLPWMVGVLIIVFLISR